MTLEDLDKHPDLVGDEFPFKGFIDFRGMPDEVWASFAAGLWRKYDMYAPAADPPATERCKWFGGRDRFGPALKALLDLGLDCTVTFPGIKLIGNGADGYEKIIDRWYRIHFKLPLP